MSLRRREFIRTVAVATATACSSRARDRALAPLAGPQEAHALPVTPMNGIVRLNVRAHPMLSKPRGALKIVPEGMNRPIWVLAREDGKGYTAVSSRCTHLGCTVDVAGWQLICPCHGSTFARDGHAIIGPARDPLERYPVVLASDGELTITLTALER